ncbi:tetratricopeptide repeat protein [Archangium sp.]|uniref:tetratricopeptide repeat protein n=1 Tax=Archangium sp. TaxID=1872627 RepID=UPI00286D3E86|nr:tetratricopeptide repeat protein [Archangium sp.]
MTSLIRSPASRFVLPVLVAVMLMGLSPVAHAAGGERDAEVLARAKFAEGNLAYDLAKFQKALDAYSEAYRLVPLPGFLFNIAQCHRQLGRPERAGFFYRRYLSLSKEEPANAGMVRELIAEMDTQVRKEQERRLTREQTARDRARAEALRAQTEAIVARQVRSKDGKKGVPSAALPTQASAEVKGEPLTKKWWVWAGAGAVALVAGGVIYAATAPQPRATTLGTIR